MALELFKPFIMSRLVERKIVQNIKAAKKYVDSMEAGGLGHPRGGDRRASGAPEPRADAPPPRYPGVRACARRGQGDPGAPARLPRVQRRLRRRPDGRPVPLSAEAQAEARILMLSSNNILSPAHGRPLATPAQDMVLGLYFLTYYRVGHGGARRRRSSKPRPKRFALARRRSSSRLQPARCSSRTRSSTARDGELDPDTPGRVIFNEEISLDHRKCSTIRR